MGSVTCKLKEQGFSPGSCLVQVNGKRLPACQATLWYGDKEEEMSGLRFVYYTEDTFGEIVGSEYQMVEATRYAEMEKDDSMCVVLRKR